MHGTDCDQEKTLSIRTGRLTMEIAHDFIAPSWPVVAAAGVMFSCGWKALGKLMKFNLRKLTLPLCDINSPSLFLQHYHWM